MADAFAGSVVDAFAQFERELIRERQREGIAVAKAKGGVYDLQVNDKSFTDGSTRSAARWKKVLNELIVRGLLVESTNGTVEITDDGYATADALLEHTKLSDGALQLLQAAAG